MEGIADLMVGLESSQTPLRLSKLTLAFVDSHLCPAPGDGGVSALVHNSAETLEHLTFRLATPAHVEATLAAVKGVKLPRLSTFGLADVGLPPDSNAGAIANECTTIKTLALISDTPIFQDEALRMFSPNLKLDKLIICLKQALCNSTQTLTNWLDLGLFARLKTLKMEGVNHPHWLAYRGGARVVAMARAKGIAEVIVKQAERPRRARR